MKLEEIADLMIGVLAKRENDENGEKSYFLFSLKNYEENQDYDILKTNKNFKEKLAQEGDLLFRLLYPNKIIYVDKTLEGILIPSQFCIIRAQKGKIDPIVLRWYLETEKVKKELEYKVTGSIIKNMSIADLKTVDMPFISNDEQKNMKELIIAWEKEKEITENILKEKEKLYNFYLEEIMKKGEKYFENK